MIKTPQQIIKEHYQKIARLGGLSKSPKKAAAARRNGLKGGRPSNSIAKNLLRNKNKS